MSKENKSILLAKLHQAGALVDQCITELEAKPPRKPTKNQAGSSRSNDLPARRDLDFDANERAFVKAHARTLSGPKKFVLLVAYLAKGKVGTAVELNEVQKRWNRMTMPNLLNGEFNRFYTSSAKESGWVNTAKQGVYVLRPSWKDIF
jgi:hypothetical protein